MSAPHLLQIGDRVVNLDNLMVATFDTLPGPEGDYPRAILQFAGSSGELPSEVVLFRAQAEQIRAYLCAHAADVAAEADAGESLREYFLRRLRAADERMGVAQ